MATQEIKQKKLGEEVRVSIKAIPMISGRYGRYDIFVEEGSAEYYLFQNAGHSTRGSYVNGATLEEVEEIFNLLQNPEDVTLVRGECSDADSQEASRFSREGKEKELERLAATITAKHAPFREVGSKYFSGFDDSEAN